MAKTHVLIAAMILTGCGQADTTTPSAGELDAYVEVEAKKMVLAKLRDPDSAKFTEFRISRKSGQPVACGSVNSKNGFGGMGGAQRFVSNGVNVSALEEETQAGTMDEVWARFC